MKKRILIPVLVLLCVLAGLAFSKWFNEKFYNSRIQEEFQEVADIVKAHSNSQIVRFAFLSDAHIGYYKDKENRAAGLAAELLSRIGAQAPYDFVLHGGIFPTVHLIRAER